LSVGLPRERSIGQDRGDGEMRDVRGIPSQRERATLRSAAASSETRPPTKLASACCDAPIRPRKAAAIVNLLRVTRHLFLGACPGSGSVAPIATAAPA